ncbi:MAG: AmmeMemoRadiSam system protein B [Gammaproteobacteria bacterium]|nr:AmmeMemoRadiSam system protein B [Gammaproteobacteria bacterium]
MNTTRPPAVAGMFYPADPAQLRQDIEHYLARATPARFSPKAIIAPHAGYIYSGPVAASAYASLIPAHNKIKHVILLGPAHRVPLIGLAAPSVDNFSTPLGKIPINKTLIKQLQRLPQVKTLDAAHELEHSLEVQLPFLQIILDDFDLLPLVVGDADMASVAEVLNLVWGDDDTLIVISSDLSHYHDYSTAQNMDQTTSRAIEQLQPEHIHYDMACGRNPVNGLLSLARKKGLKAITLDLRNSGDTAGPRDKVVGYGAYVFH